MSKQLFAFVAALLLLAPGSLLAQEGQEGLEKEYHKNIKVYQPKPILKKNRVEIGVFGTGSLNPRMEGYVGPGGMVEYHISEYFSVGAQYSQLFALASPFKDEVEENFGLFPERTELGYVTTLRLGVTPLFGKFGAGAAPYWDFSVYLGGGITHSVLSDFAPTVEAGVGLRFYLTKWMAVTADVCDLIYWEQFTEETRMLQNWTGRLGVSLFVPFTFTYGGDQ